MDFSDYEVVVLIQWKCQVVSIDDWLVSSGKKKSELQKGAHVLWEHNRLKV